MVPLKSLNGCCIWCIYGGSDPTLTLYPLNVSSHDIRPPTSVRVPHISDPLGLRATKWLQTQLQLHEDAASGSGDNINKY